MATNGYSTVQLTQSRSNSLEFETEWYGSKIIMTFDPRWLVMKLSNGSWWSMTDMSVTKDGRPGWNS